MSTITNEQESETDSKELGRGKLHRIFATFPFLNRVKKLKRDVIGQIVEGIEMSDAELLALAAGGRV